MSRADEEKRTVEIMVGLYCRAHHRPPEKANGAPALCEACRRLRDYAFRRIEKCPYGLDKPNCDRCTIHCYAPEPREAIRHVMRYAGPRMIFYHPWMAMKHLIVPLVEGVRGRFSRSSTPIRRRQRGGSSLPGKSS